MAELNKLEEASFYADRLSNLAIAMAHKEINEKRDDPDPCFAVLGKPSHKSVGVTKSFIQGSHKAAKTVQATLNHFHSTLVVQKPGGDDI
ncbi:A-kinase anchor protein 3 [Ara ararauna]